MFSSYVFAMYSAHFRDAAISAETSPSFDVPESVLGKRRRDEDDDEDKENREEVEPPCKRQCIRPIAVGFFDFEADNSFWVDNDEEDIRREAEVEIRQFRTLRWIKLQQEEYHWQFRNRIERWRKVVSPWW